MKNISTIPKETTVTIVSLFTFRSSLFTLLLNGVLILPLLGVLAAVLVTNYDLANGVVSARYFWFYPALVIAMVCTGIACVVNRRGWRPGAIDYAVGLFCLAGVAISGLHGGLAHRQTFLFLLWVLFVLVRIHLSQWKPASYCILLTCMLLALAEAVWGLRQLYGFLPSQHGLFKTTGSFFNPGPYAGYLAVAAPIAAYYLLRDYRLLSRKPDFRFTPYYIRWVVAVCTLTAIVLILPATLSRGAWLALLSGCSLAALLYAGKKKRRELAIALKRIGKKRIYLACTLLLALAVAGGAGIYLLKKDSADGRLLMWKLSLKTLQEHPFGVGLGKFAGAYGETQAAYFASGRASEREELVAGSPEYAFNEYLQVGIELGFVPLLLFLAVVGWSLAKAIRRGHAGAAGSLLALLVFACVSYPFSVLPFLIVLMFLLALCHDEGVKPPLHGKKHGAVVFACLAVAALAVAFLLKDKQTEYAAYEKWSRTRMLYHSGLFAEAAKEYEEMELALGHEIQFLFEYGRSLSKAGEHDRSNGVLRRAAKISCDPMLYNVMGQNHQALKQYAEAEECLLKATRLVPSRLYPYYLLVKLYEETGEREKREEAARLVLTKEPKVHSRAVEEMREELKVKN